MAGQGGTEPRHIPGNAYVLAADSIAELGNRFQGGAGRSGVDKMGSCPTGGRPARYRGGDDGEGQDGRGRAGAG